MTHDYTHKGGVIHANLASLETKSFAQDTAEKTGMSKRAVSRFIQIANNLTPDAKQIVKANDMTQDTALKLSRLPHDQQVEAASLLQFKDFRVVVNRGADTFPIQPLKRPSDGL